MGNLKLDDSAWHFSSSLHYLFLVFLLPVASSAFPIYTRSSKLFNLRRIKRRNWRTRDWNPTLDTTFIFRIRPEEESRPCTSARENRCKISGKRCTVSPPLLSPRTVRKFHQPFPPFLSFFLFIPTRGNETLAPLLETKRKKREPIYRPFVGKERKGKKNVEPRHTAHVS